MFTALTIAPSRIDVRVDNFQALGEAMKKEYLYVKKKILENFERQRKPYAVSEPDKTTNAFFAPSFWLTIPFKF